MLAGVANVIVGWHGSLTSAVETITWLGRTTRSCNWYPFCVTISTVLAGCSSRRLLHHGMMHVRIERRVQGLDPLAVMALQARPPSCWLHHLEAVQQRGGVGVLLGRLDRPLDVVQHRQQVAQQRQVGVAELFFEFAGGPLAVVVQFRVAAEFAVLGGLQVRRGASASGLRRRRLAASRGFGCACGFAAPSAACRLAVSPCSASCWCGLCLVTIQNNSFSFSKKLFRVGLTWAFSISASCRSAASCSGVSVLRHLDVHLHQQVAAAAVSRVGHAAALEREDLAALRAGGNRQVLRGRRASAPRSSPPTPPADS